MTRSCDSYEARYFKMEDSERDVIEYYVNLGYSSETILELLECFRGIKISLRTLKKGFACLVYGEEAMLSMRIRYDKQLRRKYLD